MAFWRCFYHVVWTVKRRAPLIDPANEMLLFEIVQDKTAELGGELLAVNAVSDHVHVAVTIPPKVAVAEWVKRVKHGVGELIIQAASCANRVKRV